MSVQTFNPPSLFAPTMYSQLAVATGTRTVFVAGQAPPGRERPARRRRRPGGADRTGLSQRGERAGLVRGRRLSTADFIAERLQVSVRTVYRDIADLQAQGVPIEGEAGVGYRMRAGFDLPPLMFTQGEAQALVASVRLARNWLDAALAAHAEAALSKIVAVLPAAARAAAESLALYAPPGGASAATRERLEQLRLAAETRRKLRLRYLDLKGVASERIVRPLACLYWGDAWTLAAWCEQRAALRNFRIDRIAGLDVLDERFRDEPGKTLADMARLEGERS